MTPRPWQAPSELPPEQLYGWLTNDQRDYVAQEWHRRLDLPTRSVLQLQHHYIPDQIRSIHKKVKLFVGVVTFIGLWCYSGYAELTRSDGILTFLEMRADKDPRLKQIIAEVTAEYDEFRRSESEEARRANQ